MTVLDTTESSPQVAIGRWADAMNNQDAHAFAACFTEAPYVIDHALGKDFHDRAEIEQYCGAWFVAFPDFRVELGEAVVAGRSAAVGWIMSGTLAAHLPGLTDGAPIGGRFAAPGASIFRFDETGAIAEESDYWSLVTMTAGIGARPPA